MSGPGYGRSRTVVGIRERWPDRVELVDLLDAGHVVLDEQPDDVAEAILDFISRRG